MDKKLVTTDRQIGHFREQLSRIIHNVYLIRRDDFKSDKEIKRLDIILSCAKDIDEQCKTIPPIAPDFDTHETLVVGWNHGKVVYCRSFNDQNDRENMMAAYDFVSKNCENYVMTSRLEKFINENK